MAPSESPRRWVTLLGLIVSAVFVALAVRHLDVHSVADVWKTARPLPWLPLAVGCYITGHFVRGQRLRSLMRREASLPLVTASNVVIVGYASNNVLPARLGELVRAGMLAERTGIPLAQSLTITLIERLLDGVAILFLLVVSALRPDTAGWIRHLAEVGSIVFGVAFTGLAIAIFVPSVLLTIAARVLNPFGAKLRDRLLGILTSIVGAAACLRRPRDAAVIGSLSIVVWLLESMMFVCMLPCVGLPFEMRPGIIAMSVTNLGILVPSTPGFVGPFHFFCSQAIQSQGATEAVSLAYAVLVHLAFYVPATLWGAGAMLWYGVQVGASAALARAAKKSPSTKVIEGVRMHVIARMEKRAKHDGPTEFDIALTEALLPEGAPNDEASVRAVAAFLADEIDALPPRLQTMYGAGMSTFRFYVRLRYMRSFCGLALAKRRAAVASWAFGRITPLRQLFRPARSTVLLAFYEAQTTTEKSAQVHVLRKKAG